MKTYFVIFFLSSTVIAQLPEDFERFTQTLENLAAKLPTSVVPPPLPSSRIITVSDTGEIILPASGQKVKAPPHSTIEIKPTGITIKVPPQGGNVQLPSEGGTIQVSSDSEITARINISGKSSIRTEKLLADETAFFPAGNIIITPIPVRMPPVQSRKIEPLPAAFISPDDGRNIKVPSSGIISVLDEEGYYIKVPTDSRVTKYKDQTYEVGLPSGGEVRLANNEKITAPAGSTIKWTQYGPLIFVASPGGDVVIPPRGQGAMVITLVNSIVQYLDKGKIIEFEMPAAEGKLFFGTIKIIPKK